MPPHRSLPAKPDFPKLEEDVDVDVAGGASCHVGYRSCFYRRIPIGETSRPLEFTEQEKVFDPQKIYGDAPNPTQL